MYMHAMFIMGTRASSGRVASTPAPCVLKSLVVETVKLSLTVWVCVAGRKGYRGSRRCSHPSSSVVVSQTPIRTLQMSISASANSFGSAVCLVTFLAALAVGCAAAGLAAAFAAAFDGLAGGALVALTGSATGSSRARLERAADGILSKNVADGRCRKTHTLSLGAMRGHAQGGVRKAIDNVRCQRHNLRGSKATVRGAKCEWAWGGAWAWGGGASREERRWRERKAGGGGGGTTSACRKPRQPQFPKLCILGSFQYSIERADGQEAAR